MLDDTDACSCGLWGCRLTRILAGSFSWEAAATSHEKLNMVRQPTGTAACAEPAVFGQFNSCRQLVHLHRPGLPITCSCQTSGHRAMLSITPRL